MVSLLGKMFDRNKKGSEEPKKSESVQHESVPELPPSRPPIDAYSDGEPNLDQIREELDEIAKLIGPGDSYDMLADTDANLTTVQLPLGEIKTLIPHAFNPNTLHELKDDDTVTILVSDLFEQLQNGEVATSAEQLLAEIENDCLAENFDEIKEEPVALPLSMVVTALKPEELSKRTTKVERDPELNLMPDVFSASSVQDLAGQAAEEKQEESAEPAPAPHVQAAPPEVEAVKETVEEPAPEPEPKPASPLSTEPPPVEDKPKTIAFKPSPKPEEPPAEDAQDEVPEMPDASEEKVEPEDQKISPFAENLDSLPNLFTSPDPEPDADEPSDDEQKMIDEAAALTREDPEPESARPEPEPAPSMGFEIPDSVGLPPREEPAPESVVAQEPSLEDLDKMMKAAEVSQTQQVAPDVPKAEPVVPGPSSRTVMVAGLDMNHADTESMVMRLDGIGPKLAMRIVEDRELNGPFRDVYDIARVQGIGQKLFETITGEIWREDLCGSRDILANILDSSKESIPDIKAVAGRMTAIKGFDGCVIAHSDGYVLASTWDHEKNDALGAFAPQMFKKVVQYIRRLEMGDMDAFTFFFEEYPITLVNSGELFIAAIHSPNRFSRRHVQIARALTVELDHRLIRMRDA